MIESTFEYLLFNIHEKIEIINKIFSIIDEFFKRVEDTSNLDLCFINSYKNIINDYSKFTTYIEKYNLEIVIFISEYYSIRDEHLEDFNRRFIHIQSSNVDNYSGLKNQPSKDSRFHIIDIINIFKEHCYKYKIYNDYNNYLSKKYIQQQSKFIYNKLNEYILYENVYEMLNNIIIEYTKFIKYHKLRINEIDENTTDRINKLLINYNKIHLNFKTTEIHFDTCKCNNKMIILPNSSELVCDKCGFIYILTGTVFDDSHFYNQSDSKFKHAGYDPSKHCKCWIDRIQAKDNSAVDASVIAKIDSCIKKDGIKNKRLITIEQLRGYLKDCNLSELNEHISLIRKMITGITPPQLTYAETQDICNSFNKAIKAYNMIKPDTKSNVLYYPYILRKLIETHISNDAKKSYLLSCIHLQGPSTLADNDNTWFKICKIVPAFTYKPTNRYEYL